MEKNFFSDMPLEDLIELLQGLATRRLPPSIEALTRLHDLELAGENVEARLRFIFGGELLRRYVAFKRILPLTHQQIEFEEPMAENKVEREFLTQSFEALVAEIGEGYVPWTEEETDRWFAVRPLLVMEDGLQLSDEQLAQSLADRRKMFFKACLRPTEETKGVRQNALNRLNELRNTKVGQRFLEQNPMFFEEIDHSIMSPQSGKPHLH